VHGGGGPVGLGRCRPHGDDAVDALLGTERPDVVTQLLGQVEVGGAGLHVRGVGEGCHPLLVEDGRHRPDVQQLVGDLLEERLVDDLGASGRVVGGDRVGVPAAEDEVVEWGEVECLGQWHTVGVAALGERPDGGCEPVAGREDAGDERGGDGTEPGEEDPEAAAGVRCGHGGAP
jgi:hypothetical protein